MTASADERADTFTSDIDEAAPRAMQGTWLLRRVTEVDAAGRVTAEPYGAHPSGQLIYGLEGPP